MRKIIAFLVMTLMIATAVLPVVGTMNEEKSIEISNVDEPTVEWLKTFGGDEFDHFHMVKQTIDEGYIACGLTEESDNYFAWLVKLDSNGNEEWSKINYDINGTLLTNTNFGIMSFDVIQTNGDNGFLVSGCSMTSDEFQGETVWGCTGFLWKTDNLGNTEWVKHYYDLEEDNIASYFFYEVIEVLDGFVMGGFKYYLSNEGELINVNGGILKTDKSGEIIWANDFEQNGEDHLSSVFPTSDGGYVLAGWIDREDLVDGALWLVKTDSNGNLQWDSIFDGPDFDYYYGKGACEASDGNFFLCGVSKSYAEDGTDIWLIKTDSSGDMLWNKTFGRRHNDYSWGMCGTEEGKLAFGICTNYGIISGTREDIWVIVSDQDGNAEWKLYISEDGTQVTRSISQTEDGGFIIAAMTNSFGNYRSDGVIAKVSAFENQRPDKPDEPDGKKRGQPDTQYTFTASATDPDGDTVTQYKWDWGDGNFSDWLDTNEANYTWTTEDSFEIRVKAMDEHGGESDWSDPLSFSTPKNKIINPIELIKEKLFELFPFLNFSF